MCSYSLEVLEAPIFLKFKLDIFDFTEEMDKKDSEA